MCLWVEIPGGEDANVFVVEDRLCKAGEEFVRVLWDERDWKGVDGELGLVGGKVERQLRGLSHREGLVELGG